MICVTTFIIKKLKREGGFFTPSSLFLTLFFRTYARLVLMLVDVRNRTSNAPVKIPCKFQAYLFRYSSVDFYEYRVVIAQSVFHACQYMKDWCVREQIDLVYTYEGEINYEVAGVGGDDYFRNLLFAE